MKKFIKILVFLIVFVIFFYIVHNLLWLKPTTISYFYDEPKNSLDVVYIGSSNAYTAFNSVLAYNLYGYTTGFLSTDCQPFIYVKYLLKESEKYQKPSIYVIDLALATEEIDNFDEGGIRNVIDSMKISQNRTDAINDILSYREDINKKDYINYYNSFLLYHNKWKDLASINVNIRGNTMLYKGFNYGKFNSIFEPQEEYIWSDELIQLSSENRNILLDLIDYIKNNNINSIFVVPKRYFEEDDNKKLNDAIRIIEENNLKVINCNTTEKLNNINFNTDLYNFAHINVYGATKYTLWFSKYLKENYNLPDHRNDEKYSSWDSEYKRFKDNFKKITDKEFDDVLFEYIKN